MSSRGLFMLKWEPMRTEARIEVRVVPASGRSGLETKGGKFSLHVRAPAEKNRANQEAERFLSRLLGRRVRLVAGRTARRKTFLVEGMTSDEVRETLLQRAWRGK